MIGNQPTNLSPSTSFVIERVSGKGYLVTSAEGDYADEWKGRALALLDVLGQPDPKGPSEHIRWVGPIAPSGEYVGVSVKLMPNGEARYDQMWFQLPKPVACPTQFIGLLIAVLLVGFAVGVFSGRTFFVPDYPTTSGAVAGSAGSSATGKPDPPAKDSLPDMGITKIRSELTSSREVRAKLIEYLSQEGFAADTSTPVVDEKRSVKLIADLDKTPPQQETIRLSNIEIAKLVKLLESLDEWTTNSIAPLKSEAR
jgi:hypothetical protein